MRSSQAYRDAALSTAEQVATGKFETARAASQAFQELNAVLFDATSATTRPGVTTPPARGR